MQLHFCGEKSKLIIALKQNTTLCRRSKRPGNTFRSLSEDVGCIFPVRVTSPPAVQLSLQPLNGLLHWPVLLLFLLVLLLPLLCRELQVHGHSVSDGLGSKSRGENTEAGERSGREGRKTVCGEKIQKGWKDRKCSRTPENRTVNRRISALAAQWKQACISLICMQIGFLPTVFGGACRDRNFCLRKKCRNVKNAQDSPETYAYQNTAITQFTGGQSAECVYKLLLNYDVSMRRHRAETFMMLQPQHLTQAVSFILGGYGLISHSSEKTLSWKLAIKMSHHIRYLWHFVYKRNSYNR